MTWKEKEKANKEAVNVILNYRGSSQTQFTSYKSSIGWLSTCHNYFTVKSQLHT